MNKFQLDELDYKIIKCLQKDGRKSFTELADEFDVAVSTIRNRYNRIVDEKIMHVMGRVDPEKIGLNAYARIMIAVKPANRTDKALESIKKLPEISFLALTSGRFNIELNVMCRNNNHLLKISDKINNIKGVNNVQITMYLCVIKWG